MGRAPCCDKASVKKGPWSPEEDAKLKAYIDQNGTGGNWIALPQKIGLKRCGKSCRLRWLNYLRPNIRHGGFSEEEDNIICSLYISIGSRWSIIAAQLPGRTDNDIKNYWNTRLKKKLLGKHRKEKRGKGRSGRSANPSSGSLIPPSTVAQPPVLPPIVPYSNEESRFNDYASIRNLLIRLGGRFSTQDQYYVHQIDHNNYDQIKPTIDESSLVIQPMYNPIDQLIPSLDTTSSSLLSQFDTVGADISAILPSSTVNLADFERVMHNSEKLQGLEFFYDEFINGGTMNSSIFANQGFLEGQMMEEFGGVDKMRYGGIFNDICHVL